MTINKTKSLKLDTVFQCSIMLVRNRRKSLLKWKDDRQLSELFHSSVSSTLVEHQLISHKAIPDMWFGSGLYSVKLYFLYLIPLYSLIQKFMNGYSSSSKGYSWRNRHNIIGRRSSGYCGQFIFSDNQFVK
jgi:hypothetical protein